MAVRLRASSCAAGACAVGFLLKNSFAPPRWALAPPAWKLVGVRNNRWKSYCGWCVHCTAVWKETVVLKCTAELECASYTTQGCLFLFCFLGQVFSLRNIIGAEAGTAQLKRVIKIEMQSDRQTKQCHGIVTELFRPYGLDCALTLSALKIHVFTSVWCLCVSR